MSARAASLLACSLWALTLVLTARGDSGRRQPDLSIGYRSHRSRYDVRADREGFGRTVRDEGRLE